MKLLSDEKQIWLREFLESLEPTLFGGPKQECQKWIDELRVKRLRRKKGLDTPTL